MFNIGRRYLKDCFNAEIIILLHLSILILLFWDLSQIRGVISDTPISTAFSIKFSNLDGDFRVEIAI